MVDQTAKFFRHGRSGKQKCQSIFSESGKLKLVSIFKCLPNLESNCVNWGMQGKEMYHFFGAENRSGKQICLQGSLYRIFPKIYNKIRYLESGK